tara:strand:- start:15829 stop:16065 length:237 start_codon:yes stop_codon:yes gene_type:complete
MRHLLNFRTTGNQWNSLHKDASGAFFTSTLFNTNLQKVEQEYAENQAWLEMNRLHNHPPFAGQVSVTLGLRTEQLLTF